MSNLTDAQKAAFYRGFVTALLWSSTDDEGEPLDSGDYELAPITKQRLKEYCDAWASAHFVDLYRATLEGRSWDDCGL